MTVVLHRVDDRLVHGQVVIGWGRPLDIGFIALVDDQVRTSDWEQDLYRMSVPEGVELIFASVREALRDLPGWRADVRRGIVLTADIETMAALHKADPAVDRINLGGIHHRPGRTERLPYVYLTDEELAQLRSLEASGATVTAQDLPTTTSVPLRSLA